MDKSPSSGISCFRFCLLLTTTKEALNHAFDKPKQWEIREINEIMNQCVTGWNYFSNPRMFTGYGRQKGWKREHPATDSDNGAEKNLTIIGDNTG